MSPGEVRRVLMSEWVPYGQDRFFPQQIDTCGCEDYFGLRCQDNVHVTSPHTAHIDRYDPRSHPLQHLDYDVGIPHEVFTRLMPEVLGTVIGAAADSQRPERGARLGQDIGGLLGRIIELAILSRRS